MRSTILLVTSALMFCSPVYAQEKVSKEQLVGTWTMVSYKNVSGGSKADIFGPQPKGMLMIDAAGRYVFLYVDPRRSPWKTDNRTQISDADLTTAAKGVVTQFGTISLEGNTVTRKIEGSINPGLREQKVTVALSGDEVTFTNPNSGVTGGQVETTFRRAK